MGHHTVSPTGPVVCSYATAGVDRLSSSFLHSIAWLLLGFVLNDTPCIWEDNKVLLKWEMRTLGECNRFTVLLSCEIWYWRAGWSFGFCWQFLSAPKPWPLTFQLPVQWVPKVKAVGSWPLHHVVPLPDPSEIWSSFCVTVRTEFRFQPAAQLKRTST